MQVITKTDYTTSFTSLVCTCLFVYIVTLLLGLMVTSSTLFFDLNKKYIVMPFKSAASMAWL